MKMISIKKSTTLWIIIVILVILNLSTLTALWLDKSPGIKRVERTGVRHRHFIEGRLNLSEEQATEYRKLRMEFFENARPYFENIRKNKSRLYQMLKTGENDHRVQALADSIGQLQTGLELLTFNHFQEVRALANPEQKAAFDSLMIRIVDHANQPLPRPDREGDEYKRKPQPGRR